jgi:hypothetical protein
MLVRGIKMILPTHARKVKVVTEAEFPSIKQIEGSLTYETTEYCIYLDESEKEALGVYRVISDRAEEPFVRIQKLEEIAPDSPKNLVHDEQLDVTSPLQVLSSLVKQEAGKDSPEIVVYLAKHNHVTFAYCDRPVSLPEIQVVDVIPPSPSKLEEGMKVLQQAGIVPNDYPITYHLIDEAKLLADLRTDSVLVPCKLNDLIDNQTEGVYTVDRNLHQIGDRSVHVLGCTRTQQAARVHGIDIKDFKSMCPKHNLPQKGFFIAKCCMLRSDVEEYDHEQALGVVVPWGFNYAQIFKAGILLQDMIIKSIVY